MTLDAETLAWDAITGLLPAVVQHADDGRVLMLGWMDRAALRATLATNRLTLFSRRRQRLWRKGETSGNALTVVELATDCDRDAILVRARPSGPTCHTGAVSCFGATAPPLAVLTATVAARLAAGNPASYTVRLAQAGASRLAQKVGEEGLEVALAAVAGNDTALTDETADLLYHLVVLLEARGLGLAPALAELERRRGAGNLP